MKIPFTRYHLPNGHQTVEHFETDEFTPELESLVQKLLDEGCKFEIEVLRTGEINMDCQTKNGLLLAQSLTSNSPEIVTAIEVLVRSAHKQYTSGTDVYGDPINERNAE